MTNVESFNRESCKVESLAISLASRRSSFLFALLCFFSVAGQNRFFCRGKPGLDLSHGHGAGIEHGLRPAFRVFLRQVVARVVKDPVFVAPGKFFCIP